MKQQPSLVKHLLLGVLAVGAALFVTASGVAQKPNVLFIAVDDLRPELGGYGKDFIKSPNLDRIAKSGMGYTLRTERYRFTRWVIRDDPGKVLAVELYDHQTDPQENTNVADRPANAAVVKELAVKLDAGWRAARPQ